MNSRLNRQVCYPWHRWYGQTILTRRAGGAHADIAYFCKLLDSPLDAMLVEIPKWMFDQLIVHRCVSLTILMSIAQLSAF